MKKQIKLALLGTMLFTGASSMCMEAEKTADAVEALETPVVKQDSTPVDNQATKEVSALPQTPIDPVDPTVPTEKSFLNKCCTFVKDTATNKWVLISGAAVVGCLIAYKIYQACNEDQDEAEAAELV